MPAGIVHDDASTTSGEMRVSATERQGTPKHREGIALQAARDSMFRAAKELLTEPLQLDAKAARQSVAQGALPEASTGSTHSELPRVLGRLHSPWWKQCLLFLAGALKELIEPFIELLLINDDMSGSNACLAQSMLAECSHAGAAPVDNATGPAAENHADGHNHYAPQYIIRAQQAAIRAVETMRPPTLLALGLTHPSMELRNLVLSEMRQFNIEPGRVAKELIVALGRSGERKRPGKRLSWFSQLAAIESLGLLQQRTPDVISALVEIWTWSSAGVAKSTASGVIAEDHFGAETKWTPAARTEALKALGALGVQHNMQVVEALVQPLDAAHDAARRALKAAASTATHVKLDLTPQQVSKLCKAAELALTNIGTLRATSPTVLRRLVRWGTSRGGANAHGISEPSPNQDEAKESWISSPWNDDYSGIYIAWVDAMQHNALLTLASMIAIDEHNVTNEEVQTTVQNLPLMQLGARAIFEIGLLDEGEQGVPQRLHRLCSDWRIDELVEEEDNDGVGMFAHNVDNDDVPDMRVKHRAMIAAIGLRSLTSLIGKHESPRVRSAATRALLPVVGITPYSIAAVLEGMEVDVRDGGLVSSATSVAGSLRTMSSPFNLLAPLASRFVIASDLSGPTVDKSAILMDAMAAVEHNTHQCARESNTLPAASDDNGIPDGEDKNYDDPGVDERNGNTGEDDGTDADGDTQVDVKAGAETDAESTENSDVDDANEDEEMTSVDITVDGTVPSSQDKRNVALMMGGDDSVPHAITIDTSSLGGLRDDLSGRLDQLTTSPSLRNAMHRMQEIDREILAAHDEEASKLESENDMDRDISDSLTCICHLLKIAVYRHAVHSDSKSMTARSEELHQQASYSTWGAHISAMIPSPTSMRQSMTVETRIEALKSVIVLPLALGVTDMVNYVFESSPREMHERDQAAFRTQKSMLKAQLHTTVQHICVCTVALLDESASSSSAGSDADDCLPKKIRRAALQVLHRFVPWLQCGAAQSWIEFIDMETKLFGHCWDALVDGTVSDIDTEHISMDNAWRKELELIMDRQAVALAPMSVSTLSREVLCALAMVQLPLLSKLSELLDAEEQPQGHAKQNNDARGSRYSSLLASLTKARLPAGAGFSAAALVEAICSGGEGGDGSSAGSSDVTSAGWRTTRQIRCWAFEPLLAHVRAQRQMSPEWRLDAHHVRRIEALAGVEADDGHRLERLQRLEQPHRLQSSSGARQIHALNINLEAMLLTKELRIGRYEVELQRFEGETKVDASSSISADHGSGKQGDLNKVDKEVLIDPEPPLLDGSNDMLEWLRAARDGNISTLQRLYNSFDGSVSAGLRLTMRRRLLVTAEPTRGFTALHFAVGRGHLVIVKWLMDREKELEEDQEREAKNAWATTSEPGTSRPAKPETNSFASSIKKAWPFTKRAANNEPKVLSPRESHPKAAKVGLMKRKAKPNLGTEPVVLSQAVTAWSVDQVQRWIEQESSLRQYAAKFGQFHITGHLMTSALLRGDSHMRSVWFERLGISNSAHQILLKGRLEELLLSMSDNESAGESDAESRAHAITAREWATKLLQGHVLANADSTESEAGPRLVLSAEQRHRVDQVLRYLDSWWSASRADMIAVWKWRADRVAQQDRFVAYDAKISDEIEAAYQAKRPTVVVSVEKSMSNAQQRLFGTKFEIRFGPMVQVNVTGGAIRPIRREMKRIQDVIGEQQDKVDAGTFISHLWQLEYHPSLPLAPGEWGNCTQEQSRVLERAFLANDSMVRLPKGGAANDQKKTSAVGVSEDTALDDVFLRAPNDPAGANACVAAGVEEQFETGKGKLLMVHVNARNGKMRRVRRCLTADPEPVTEDALPPPQQQDEQLRRDPYNNEMGGYVLGPGTRVSHGPGSEQTNNSSRGTVVSLGDAPIDGHGAPRVRVATVRWDSPVKKKRAQLKESKQASASTDGGPIIEQFYLHSRTKGVHEEEEPRRVTESRQERPSLALTSADEWVGDAGYVLAKTLWQRAYGRGLQIQRAVYESENFSTVRGGRAIDLTHDLQHMLEQQGYVWLEAILNFGKRAGVKGPQGDSISAARVPQSRNTWLMRKIQENAERRGLEADPAPGVSKVLRVVWKCDKRHGTAEVVFNADNVQTSSLLLATPGRQILARWPRMMGQVDNRGSLVTLPRHSSRVNTGVGILPLFPPRKKPGTPLSPTQMFAYFEVILHKVMDLRSPDDTRPKRKDSAAAAEGGIAIGLVPRTYKNDRMPGWDNGSLALHLDSGALYRGKSYGSGGEDDESLARDMPRDRTGTLTGRVTGPLFTKPFEDGEVVGLGLDFVHSCVFFTRNGQLLAKPEYSSDPDVSDDDLGPDAGNRSVHRGRSRSPARGNRRRSSRSRSRSQKRRVHWRRSTNGQRHEGWHRYAAFENVSWCCPNLGVGESAAAASLSSHHSTDAQKLARVLDERDRDGMDGDLGNSAGQELTYLHNGVVNTHPRGLPARKIASDPHEEIYRLFPAVGASAQGARVEMNFGPGRTHGQAQKWKFNPKTWAKVAGHTRTTKDTAQDADGSDRNSPPKTVVVIVCHGNYFVRRTIKQRLLQASHSNEHGIEFDVRLFDKFDFNSAIKAACSTEAAFLVATSTFPLEKLLEAHPFPRPVLPNTPQGPDHRLLRALIMSKTAQADEQLAQRIISQGAWIVCGGGADDASEFIYRRAAYDTRSIRAQSAAASDGVSRHAGASGDEIVSKPDGLTVGDVFNQVWDADVIRPAALRREPEGARAADSTQVGLRRSNDVAARSVTLSPHDEATMLWQRDARMKIGQRVKRRLPARIACPKRAVEPLTSDERIFKARVYDASEGTVLADIARTELRVLANSRAAQVAWHAAIDATAAAEVATRYLSGMPTWQACGGNIAIQKNGLLVAKPDGRHRKADNWKNSVAVGDMSWNSGQHEWEVMVVGRREHSIRIGVCSSSLDVSNTDYAANNRDTWCIGTGMGALWGGGQNGKVSLAQGDVKPVRKNTRLGLRLDLDAGTLDFFHGGLRPDALPHPAGHTGIVGPVRPFVEMMKAGAAVQFLEPVSSTQKGDESSNVVSDARAQLQTHFGGDLDDESQAQENAVQHAARLDAQAARWADSATETDVTKARMIHVRVSNTAKPVASRGRKKDGVHAQNNWEWTLKVDVTDENGHGAPDCVDYVSFALHETFQPR
eukprot:g1396.t1